MLIICGIKNCSTMRKTFTWLDEHKIEYHFHNYKTEGLSKDMLKNILTLTDWQTILNTKGLTWRNLESAQKSAITNENAAIEIMLANTSIIKRPILIDNNRVLVGFSQPSYEQFFGVNND